MQCSLAPKPIAGLSSRTQARPLSVLAFKTGGGGRKVVAAAATTVAIIQLASSNHLMELLLCH